jgi:hypothetical protein
MALIKCRECGKEISSKAQACPNCGAAARKGFGCVGSTLIIIAGVFVIGAIVSGIVGKEPPTPTAPKAKEQLAAEKAKADREQARGAKAVAAGVVVKSSLRDPESVVWESIRANDDASIICIEYRARNGFGGMNRGFVVFVKDRPSQEPSAWNKNCTQPLGGVAYAEEMIKALSAH